MLIFDGFNIVAPAQIMGLSYAVTAPLVLPAAAGFFFTAWVRRRTLGMLLFLVFSRSFRALGICLCLLH